jgi:23S rRNA U2552 (ribose-2'-O)-methylase RlmE/FtsJ
MKLFSDVEAESLKLLRGSFTSVAIHRPPSTRKGSAEIYAVAAEPRPCAPE